MNLQIAIRFFKLKLHFPTKVSKNQKAWWTNFRYIMGLYSFGSKLFLYVKYLKNRIWSAKSSPVTGSTLHTAHCTLHTVQYTLHLYLHLHLPCLWTIKNTHWTLHTANYIVYIACLTFINSQAYRQKVPEFGLKMVVAKWTLIYIQRRRKTVLVSKVLASS